MQYNSMWLQMPIHNSMYTIFNHMWPSFLRGPSLNGPRSSVYFNYLHSVIVALVNTLISMEGDTQWEERRIGGYFIIEARQPFLLTDPITVTQFLMRAYRLAQGGQPKQERNAVISESWIHSMIRPIPACCNKPPLLSLRVPLDQDGTL